MTKIWVTANVISDHGVIIGTNENHRFCTYLTENMCIRVNVTTNKFDVAKQVLNRPILFMINNNCSRKNR